jgi:hypothetical protein
MDEGKKDSEEQAQKEKASPAENKNLKEQDENESWKKVLQQDEKNFEEKYDFDLIEKSKNKAEQVIRHGKKSTVKEKYGKKVLKRRALIVVICILILLFLILLFTKACHQGNVSPQKADAVSSQLMEPVSQPSDSMANSDSSNIFDHAAFLGNSLLEDLNTYGLVGNSDCFFRKGLNVSTAMDETMIGHNIPVVEELNNGKNYDRVYLVFGENELGWSSRDTFISEYKTLIQKVKEYQPNAKIYLTSLFPVAKAVSNDQDERNLTNSAVDSANEELKEIAKDTESTFVDVASAVKNSEGALPDDASTDGIHPNMEYCQKWVDYLVNLG